MHGKTWKNAWEPVPIRRLQTGNSSGASSTLMPWCCVTVPSAAFLTNGSMDCQDSNWNMISLVDTTGAQSRNATNTTHTETSRVSDSFVLPSFQPSAYAWESLYAAYRYYSLVGLYSVRNRNYIPRLGTWGTRDRASKAVSTRKRIRLRSGRLPLSLLDPYGLDPAAIATAR